MSSGAVCLYLFVVACWSFAAAREPNQKDQITTLNASDMKRQTLSCKPHEIKRGLLPKGTIVPIWISIDEQGNIYDLWGLSIAVVSLKTCNRPTIHSFSPSLMQIRARPGDVKAENKKLSRRNFSLQCSSPWLAATPFSFGKRCAFH